MIRVGVLGATGYAGIELCRLLASHPEVEITCLVSHSYAGKKIWEVYPNFRNILDITLEDLDIASIKERCDLVFTALPHGVSKTVIPTLYDAGLRVIDLSGDFRYNDVAVYEKWYGEPHPAPALSNQAVYGLCELHREEIKKTRIVGNPGCYTTCSIMAMAPLCKNRLIDTKSIIIDAKSGVTGAGRTEALPYQFCECTENMKAYKIAKHRHTSEIEQELSLLAGEDIMLSFTPHLVPLKRGILATCYANLKEITSREALVDVYKSFYKDEHFVRVQESGVPETKNVAGSNFVDIGLEVDARLGRVVVVSAVDNIIKAPGARRCRNMNIMLGLPETCGLNFPGYYL